MPDPYSDENKNSYPAGSTATLNTSTQAVTLTLKGPGTVEFGWMYYYKAGTYTYTVVEKAGSTSGWTYDRTIYKLTVVVTKDANGNLSAKETIKDSNGNEININMDIELTKAVSFNGLKHEWTDGKAGGKASPDITVKISGGIENYADIKKIKIKNNKNASADFSKKPAVIITLKPTGSDKAVKKSLNEINKTLKKDAELTFEIKPLDLTYMGDSLHGVPNGKKTKLKKLTADVPAGSSTKTVKLSKKDFSVDQIDAENGTATITGKGTCKGTVTIKF